MFLTDLFGLGSNASYLVQILPLLCVLLTFFWLVRPKAPTPMEQAPMPFYRAQVLFITHLQHDELRQITLHRSDVG